VIDASNTGWVSKSWLITSVGWHPVSRTTKKANSSSTE